MGKKSGAARVGVKTVRTSGRKAATETAARAVEPTSTPAAAAGAPPVLLSYQQAWVKDRASVAVWEKSRRIGASWCDASDSVLEAAAEDGQDVLYIGYSEDMTREYIDDCGMWARAFNFAASELREVMFDDVSEKGDIRQIKAFRIDFASGFKILALSSRPRSIRGKQGKVTIDEAAYHDDLPGLLKAALAMLIWGGRVRILSSHNGEDNPFNLLCKDVRAGKLRYSLHRTTFGDAVDAGLYDRAKLVLGKRFGYEDEDWNFVAFASREQWVEHMRGNYGDSAAEELDCIPAMGSGVYIPRTIVERASRAECRVIRWAKPPEWMFSDRRLEETDAWIADVLKPAVDALDSSKRHVKGRDFGRSGDLSVDSILEQYDAGRWRAALTLELRGLPFDVQEKIDTWLLENLPHFHHGKYDARGNGQQLAEAALLKYGPARIECVMASSKWYAENFPPYKAALEDQSCLVAKDEDEITDHRRIVLKSGYPTMDDGRDKGSDGKQRHGDRAIARVLSWAATRTEGEPPAGESIAPPADFGLPAAMRERRRPRMGLIGRINAPRRAA